MSTQKRVSAFHPPKPEDTVLLQWEEGDYAGLAVRCRKSISMGLYESLTEEADTVAGVFQRFRRFGGEVLLEWNLDGADGQPLEASAEGFMSIPGELQLDITRRFFEEVMGIPIPLDEPSANGNSASEESPPPSPGRGDTSNSGRGSGSRRKASGSGP